MGRLKISVHPLTWVALAGLLFLGGALEAGMWAAVLLAHELAHLLVAEATGVEAEGLRIYPFGAALDMPHLERASLPAQILVALAGPLQNLFLLALALGIGRMLPLNLTHLLAFARLNLAMAAVNLLPAFPLDGGRVLLAVLLKKMDPRAARTLALLFAYGVAAVVALASFVMLLSGIPAAGGLFLGGAIFLATRRESQLPPTPVPASMEERRLRLQAGRVMKSGGLVAVADTRLGDVMKAFRPDRYHRVLVVDPDLAFLGELTEEDLRRGLFGHGIEAPIGKLIGKR